MAPAHTFDLAIIGAGAAGSAAAWAVVDAARQRGRSIRIALIDQADRAGGVVTAAMHRSLCGLYADAPGDPRNTLNAGAQRLAVEQMLAHSPDAVRVRQFGQASVLEFPPSAWQAALTHLISDSAITAHFNTQVQAVACEGRRITSLQTAAGPLVADAFIDCTGVGSLIALAGDDVATPLDHDRPLGGFAIRLADLRGDAEQLRLAVPYTLAHALQQDESTIPASARLATFYPGPGEGCGVLKLAIDPAEDAVSSADRIVALLRSQLPAMREARVVEQSAVALPRDGRRLIGRETLTESAVLAGQRSPGDVSHGWWPIEWWGDAGPTYAFPPAGEPYGVTREMLQSAVIDNLFAAGSCLSATGRAAASSRVSGICLATGDAAGRLASDFLNSRG